MTYKKGDTIPLQYVIEEWNVDTQGTEVHNLSGESVTFSMYCMDADFSIEDRPCSVVVASGLRYLLLPRRHSIFMKGCRNC